MGELLRATFDLYRRNVRLVLAVTVPIVAIVTGVTSLGLGELSARFNPGPPVRDAEIDFAALELVTVPLISAMLARWVFLMRGGERIDLADLVANALEAFPAVLFVIVVWIVVSILGFVSLIVPGVYVFVSWYFVVQAVVIDGDRGFAAITRSAALVRGRWWQSAIVGIAFRLAAFVPQGLIVLAFTPVARSTNSYAIVVLAAALTSVVAVPFLAIGATLYYLELRDAAGTTARP